MRLCSSRTLQVYSIVPAGLQMLSHTQTSCLAWTAAVFIFDISCLIWTACFSVATSLWKRHHCAHHKERYSLTLVRILAKRNEVTRTNMPCYRAHAHHRDAICIDLMFLPVWSITKHRFQGVTISYKRRCPNKLNKTGLDRGQRRYETVLEWSLHDSGTWPSSELLLFPFFLLGLMFLHCFFFLLFLLLCWTVDARWMTLNS